MALVITACGGETDGQGGSNAGPGENVPGRHDETLTAGDQTRQLIVYVPEAINQQAVPVVFMLHGTSQTAQKFYDDSGWKEKADSEKMIVVFPDALTHCFFEDENHDGDFLDAGERKVTAKWSSGQIGDAFPLCSAADIASLPPDKQALVDHPVADDLAFFDAMLDLLSEKYLVDEKAVYVSGFSNGGQMSARLAMERSEVFAAAHAAAGTLTVQSVATRPISMVFSFGNLDDRFTSAAGITKFPLTEEGLIGTPLFLGVVGPYLNGLQLTQTYSFDTVKVSHQSVARFSFSDSRMGADNSLDVAVVEGLFHQYPDGNNHVLSAADTLWPFFLAHRIP